MCALVGWLMDFSPWLIETTANGKVKDDEASHISKMRGLDGNMAAEQIMKLTS